tara:strand:+ start:5041 stop:5538 length:498 start_codon:yes stop_codon:yes gene_type:complete
MIYNLLQSEQFWVLIAFIIFVAAVFRPVRKMLATNLDGKIQEIKDTINEAEKLKNEAQLTLSEIKKRQNEVIKEIEQINQQTEQRISIINNDLEIKLKDQLDKRNKLNSMKIEQVSREAKNEVRQYILQTSLAVVTDILEKKLDEKNKQNLIDNSINDIERVLKN